MSNLIPSWVPLQNFGPHTWISSRYKRGTGKEKLRSCQSCRSKKTTCSGPLDGSFICDRCKGLSLDCRYELTRTERLRLEKILSSQGKEVAYEEMGIRQSTTAPSPPPDHVVEQDFPHSLFQMMKWADGFFEKFASFSPTLSKTAFDLMAGEDVSLIHTVALLGAIISKTVRLDDKQVVWMYKNVKDRLTRIGKVPVTVTIFNLFLQIAITLEEYRPEKERELVWKMIQGTNLSEWIKPQTGNFEWIVAQTFRVNVWRAISYCAGTDISDERVRYLLPLSVLAKIPLSHNYIAYQKFDLESSMDDVEESWMDPDEWEWKWTIGWMYYPKGHEKRDWFMKNLSDLVVKSHLPLIYVGIVILYRLRGSITLWEGSGMTDEEDLGPLEEGMVGYEELLGYRHWEEIVDELFDNLPREVAKMDSNGDGAGLYKWSLEVGGGLPGRIIVGLNALHDAKRYCVVRGFNDGKVANLKPDDFILEVFVPRNGDPWSDARLSVLIQESFIMSKNIESLLTVSEPLVVLVGAMPDQLGWLCLFHIAVGRRLKKLGLVEWDTILQDCEAQVEAGLRVLREYQNLYPIVGSVVRGLEKILESEEEPRLRDLEGYDLGPRFLFKVATVARSEGSS